jgi:hypothetical protein
MFIPMNKDVRVTKTRISVPNISLEMASIQQKFLCGQVLNFHDF